ncbi:JmjC domain-containing protein [Actinomadura alba]|uniref:JmjC domain-containing protein n=1 Tax=Actinomadura alba TaxID=406431 RepID=A0ABR7LR01_9ACTN|nr:cupin domain-containing protein [Actinomadura alba]MBC6467267.1 hypothetical protein [Actinomadura alba]
MGTASRFYAEILEKGSGLAHIITQAECEIFLGARVPDILNTNLRADQVSISTAGRLHHANEYTTSRVHGNQAVNDIVDPARALELVDAGATLILANVESWLPSVIKLGDALRQELGSDVQAHVFLTGSDRRGIPPHADGEDNFLIQLEGVKEWRIWESTNTSVRYVTEAELGEPTCTVRLEPGDILYFPVGWIHSATAGSPGSTHVTFQVVPTPLAEAIADQLYDALSTRLGDRFAPVPVTEPLSREMLDDLVQRLIEHTDRRDQ